MLILTGVIAGVLPAADFIKTMGDKADNPNYIGFIVSSLLLGALVGCVPSAYIADIFGRKKAIFVGACIFIMGGAMYVLRFSPTCLPRSCH